MSHQTFKILVQQVTGLSDFHKMVITVMKMTFQKNPPKELHYRGYTKFDQAVFEEELGNKLNNEIDNYDTLDKHAPLKKSIKSKPVSSYD